VLLKREGHKMNSNISRILRAENRKKRLLRLLRSTPEPIKNGQSTPLALDRRQRPSLATQRGSVSIEASIWIASYVLAVLGLVNAAYSEQPLLWLAVWPAPIALASTIFIFFRQGFHFRNGVLVLGRRRN
jgi:hypothetical protein